MEAEESEGVVSDAPPLRRSDLDGVRCAVPICTALHGGVRFLHIRCHPSAAQEVAYEDGVLTVRCCKCQSLTVRIAVAE